MNIYSVYKGSSKNDCELIIIKQGFSIFAAIFNVLWAIYHRMWGVVIAMFLTTLLVVLMTTSSPNVDFLFDFLIFLVFGFFAAEIREYYAYKKGYILSDIVLAHNEEDAESKYYSHLN